MIIKFKDELRGGRIHSRVFIGPDKDHLALAGKLVLRLDEWQWFGVALILGAERMNMTQPGKITVLMPDQLEVVEGDIE